MGTYIFMCEIPMILADFLLPGSVLKQFRIRAAEMKRMQADPVILAPDPVIHAPDPGFSKFWVRLWICGEENKDQTNGELGRISSIWQLYTVYTPE